MDEGWIRKLYARHGAMVYRRAKSLLGDEEAAWDVVQEVFVRAVRHRGAFRHHALPTTWLYRITTNYCFNQLRDASRRREKLRQMPALSLRRDDPDLRLTLSVVLEQLPEQLCEIAVYYHLDRMSHDEIASLLGLSRRTVGNRLKEFQDRAQRLLGDSITLPA